MTDLLHVVPDLDVGQYTHIIPSLEKALITSNDLLTLDALDIAKRAQVPLAAVRGLTADVLERLHDQLETLSLATVIPSSDDALLEKEHTVSGSSSNRALRISTLDAGIDASLGGGFPAGYLSEITGESAAGKTQLLLSLCLAVQLPAPYGLSKSALYITTEAPLATTRLSQILEENPMLSQYDDSVRPTLSKIQSTKVGDLEAQEHILQYQVPVAIERGNIGLVVIDSIAANFRAEFDKGGGVGKRKSAEAFAERSRELTRLGSHLKGLAEKHNIAIVVANQVLDRFTAVATTFEYGSQPASQTPSHRSDSGNGRLVPGHSRTERHLQAKGHDPQNGNSQPEMMPILSSLDPLGFDHQYRFFTGWGDYPSTYPFSLKYHAAHPKTPSLGMAWTSQLSARLVLLKEPVCKAQDYILGPGSDIVGWRRTIKFVFGQWSADDNGEDGTEFEIWSGGIRALVRGHEVSECAEIHSANA